MPLIQYMHQRLPLLVHVLSLLLFRALMKGCRRLVAVCRPGRPVGRLLIALVVICTLVLEGVMIYMLTELVELCISLFELFPVLYRKHMEILLS